MSRRNAAGFGNDALENEDSDQSISEEDEGLDSEWTRDAISLGGGENDKGKMRVLSQLELFRESCTHEIASHGKRGGYKVEDEVEPPFFNDESSPSRYHGIVSATVAHSNKGLIYLQDVPSISYSDEEIISDEEKISPHIFTSVGENLAITWSEASRELEALVQSNGKPCCSSNHHDVFVKERKSSSKGGGSRRKAKAKFSFPCHSETSSDNILVADEIGAVADEEMHNNMGESQLNIHDKHILPFEVAQKHETRGHSMAEILSGFLERSDLQEGSSGLELQKRRREHLVRNAPPSGDSIQEDNDIPETLDSDTSFESEGENAQSVKSIISRTVADQFHEAFRTVSADDDTLHVSFPSPLRGRIYRKLQQVMQIEKERDVDSLKNASGDTSFKDEGMSILVRILSRSLEAKLIVCSCICVGDGKNLPRETRTMTIIFKPRVSNDAELEVGNLIRIHPPCVCVNRKEVQVKDEKIFLCSYFSQVQP